MGLTMTRPSGLDLFCITLRTGGLGLCHVLASPTLGPYLWLVLHRRLALSREDRGSFL